MDTKDFRKELAQLLNSYSLENGSDTPDFILAEYLAECLYVFDKTVSKRTAWYKPVQTITREDLGLS